MCPPCRNGTALPGGIPCGGGNMVGGAIVLNGNVVFNLDRYDYVSQKYDVWWDQEWINLGYLAIFIAVFQVLALYGTNKIRHIVR